MKQPIALDAVQETSLIPLYARAEESRKAKPIIRDPKAIEIVDALDFDFRPLARSRRTLLGCCLRALQFDDWVRQFLNAHPNGTVIELGAGLNSRFERLDNGQCRWFDLDLPESIELRRKFFAESDRRRFLAASLMDHSWREEVARTGGPYLFVAEAVLMYLRTDEVKQFLIDLADQFPGSALAFDSVNELMMTRSQEDKAFERVRGQFGFHTNDIREVVAWDRRFHLEDHAHLGEVARRNRWKLPIPVLIVGRILSLMFPRTAKSYHLHLLRFGASG